MSYSEQEARELVVQAGRRLREEGLIARTWGNLSARISDDCFVITPSGQGYEHMSPKDLVTVRISDCSYEGDRKPSSEKGIHADAYRLRPEVNFVIHTHQDRASVYGILGEDLWADEDFPMLGRVVPCAKYGLPSTKKLRQSVAEEIAGTPGAYAVLMKNHGALCMGKDYAGAFLVSRELEWACAREIRRLQKEKGMPEVDARSGREVEIRELEIRELGKSQRKGNCFCHLLNGERRVYDLRSGLMELPPAAAVHGAIYKSSDACYIAQETAGSVMEVCAMEKRLLPYLDDLAQIAGASVRFSEASPAAVAKALKGRNAVLIRESGALCTGKTAEDVAAVRALLRKGCEAGLLAKGRDCPPIGEADARLQRLIYKRNYSKKKDSGENTYGVYTGI